MNPLTLVVLCCIITCIGGSLVSNVCHSFLEPKEGPPRKWDATDDRCDIVSSIFSSLVCIVFAIVLAQSSA